MSNDTIKVPRKPFRILRHHTFTPCGIAYGTQEARDKAAQRYADRDGKTVLTELWAADHPQDSLNKGWACDGAVPPAGMAIVHLAIQNHYELYGRIDTEVTATIPLPPPVTEPDDPWATTPRDEWEQTHIYDHTGTGRTEGDSWYFVEITASSSPELIGMKFEFGF